MTYYTGNSNSSPNRRRLTTIAIDRINYEALKNLGKTGMSFNDVLTGILLRIGARQDRD